MTIALCVRCGILKHGAFNLCESCGFRPVDDRDMAYSLALTDHYFTIETLHEIGAAIPQKGMPSLPPEQEKALIKAVRSPRIQRIISVHRTEVEAKRGAAAPSGDGIVALPRLDLPPVSSDCEHGGSEFRASEEIRRLRCAATANEIDENQTRHEFHISKSLLGLGLAVVIFLIVSIIGGILFKLFDLVRGLGDDRLQAIFREIVVPAVGGYAAMAGVESWIEKANTRFVFCSFAAIILVYLGLYIGLVGPVASNIGIGTWEMIWTAMSIIAAVVGAYMCAKESI